MRAKANHLRAWLVLGGNQLKVRHAVIKDAYGIAKVHVDSWSTTYKGIVAHSLLDSLTYEGREELWKRNIVRPENNVYVAEDEDGRIIGFADGSKRAGESAVGDLTSIYLLEELQSRGIGKALLEHVFKDLKQQGCSILYTEVLEDNVFQGFYEACGARLEERRTIEIAGDELGLLIYKWMFPSKAP